MRWSLERFVPLAFAWALALLVGVSVVSYRSTAALLEDARRVMYTHEVLSELDGTLLALKDAETGQRGFLLTGVEDHLTPYSAGGAAVGERLRRLRELTADNPGQQRRLDAVGPLVTARLAKLRESVDRRRAGLPPAAESLAVGKQLMDELSLRLAEMAAEERRLLGERERRSQAAAGRALAVVMLGSLLAALVTALAYLAVRRELAGRRAAEASSSPSTASWSAATASWRSSPTSPRTTCRSRCARSRRSATGCGRSTARRSADRGPGLPGPDAERGAADAPADRRPADLLAGHDQGPAVRPGRPRPGRARGRGRPGGPRPADRRERRGRRAADRSTPTRCRCGSCSRT